MGGARAVLGAWRSPQPPHIQNTTALTMSSDRTTPLAVLPCPSTSATTAVGENTVWLWLCYRYEMQEAAKAQHGVTPSRALPVQEACGAPQQVALSLRFVWPAFG